MTSPSITSDGDWIPRQAAADKVGVSMTTVRRWVEAGDVRAEMRGKVWFVCLPDVEQRSKHEGSTAAPTEEAADTAELVGAATTHLRALGEYVRTLQEPAKKLLEMYAQENERLRTRCQFLENKCTSMLEAHEKNLTEEHARQMERRQFEVTKEHHRKILEELVGYGHIVAGHVGRRLGVGDAVEEHALRRLVIGMPEEMFGTIARSVPREMAAMLAEIRLNAKKVVNGKASEEDSSAAA